MNSEYGGIIRNLTIIRSAKTNEMLSPHPVEKTLSYAHQRTGLVQHGDKRKFVGIADGTEKR